MSILNNGIIEGEYQEPRQRSFGSVSLGVPNAGERFDPRYFETIPTVWAQAHAFEGRLLDAGTNAPVDSALGEWLALLALDFFGVVHFSWIEASVLQDRRKYDPDLWKALSRTWPRSFGPLTSIGILAASGVSVGAYYPSCCFFPARGRSSWASCVELQRFVDNGALVWDRVRRGLFDSPEAILEFREHVAGVADTLGNGELGTNLRQLVSSATFFDHDASVAFTPGIVDRDPTKWKRRVQGADPKQLLSSYPLKHTNQATGLTTYYLVSNMPEPTSWMTTPAAVGGTAPRMYQKKGDHTIVVHHRLGPVTCELGSDKAVEVSELLLIREVPYCCALPRVVSGFLDLHRKPGPLAADASGSRLPANETGVYLFPGRPDILKHFPEIADPSKSELECEVDTARAAVVWTWKLDGKPFRLSRPVVARESIADLRLAIWPPMQSPQWKFYVARGSGIVMSNVGCWTLIGDDGSRGEYVQLSAETYLSILRTPDRATPPRALWLRDKPANDPDGVECGLVFLKAFEAAPHENHVAAKLAVDFGTSNTSIGYKLSGAGGQGEARALTFSLSPLCVWSREEKFEQYGFAPASWGGQKGYFPSVLIALKSAAGIGTKTVSELLPQHLFMVDIPGLHAEGNAVDFEAFTGLHHVFDNLKWRWKSGEAWGHMFLGVALLYAHAELCLKHGARITSHTFTYPLSFEQLELDTFTTRATESVTRVEEFVYGNKWKGSSVNTRDESQAIATTPGTSKDEHTLQTFIDIGGGTTDVAILYGRTPIVLDSVKVAGAAFFSAADEVLRNEKRPGANTFYEQLSLLLLGKRLEASGMQPDQALRISTSPLGSGSVYSMFMNELSGEEFYNREKEALSVDPRLFAAGNSSYQRFRTWLIFRHVITYALIQACATLAHGGPDETARIAATEIHLTLSGNGWGLLVYAGRRRGSAALKAEVEGLLQMILRVLADGVASQEELGRLEGVKIGKLTLIGEGTRSADAKTAVAIGALRAEDAAAADRERIVAYTGINIEQLKADKNPAVEIRWCDPWTQDYVAKAVGGEALDLRGFKSMTFGLPVETGKPCDPVLSIFTRLANEINPGVDLMESSDWKGMNSDLQQASYLDGRQLSGKSPLNLFLSTILYPKEGTTSTHYTQTLANRAGCLDDES